MAAIDISSPASGGSGGGNLQLSGGASMTSTLTYVTDTSNTASTLKLSTTSVQVTSTLKITTSDNPYIDAEDGAGNNRFQVGRDPSSQVVNIDFASNPTGGTNQVGAIRTYTDGVNLAEVMSFRKDGNIGIGTSSPTSKLQVTESFTTTANNYSSVTFDGTLTSRATASDTIYGFRNTQSIVATATGQTIIANDLTPNYTFFDGNTNYIGLKVGGSANTQNLGSAIWCVQKATAGNNGLAISPYNTRWAIGMTSGTTNNITGCDLIIGQSGIGVGISGGNPNARLEVKGSGSTSATTSLLVQNSAGTTLLSLRDDKNADFNGSTILNVGTLYANAVALGYINSSGNAYSVMRTNNSTGNATFDQFVAIGTTSAPVASAALEVVSTSKGFLPPRMTNAQRSAIASPAEGLQIHNTTNNGVAYYDGTNWGYLSGAKQSITITGATQTIFGGNGNIVALTMQSSTTLTFSNHVVGTYIFQITQGGTGSYTITWPVSVLWSGGTAPTLTTTVGKTDIVTLFHDGTNFFGTYSLNY